MNKDQDIDRSWVDARTVLDLNPRPGTTNAGSTGETDPMHTFDNGAKRSSLKPRYDLIPKHPLERLAARYAVGLKYGEHNWKLGLPFDDTFNHILDHLLTYRERRKKFLQDRSEFPDGAGTMTLKDHMEYNQTDGDDLAAAMWGIATLMELERTDRLK
jgi:dATP/dGTP diphosphohydrolase